MTALLTIVALFASSYQGDGFRERSLPPEKNPTHVDVVDPDKSAYAVGDQARRVAIDKGCWWEKDPVNGGMVIVCPSPHKLLASLDRDSK